jgi:hypothetical protein
MGNQFSTCIDNQGSSEKSTDSDNFVTWGELEAKQGLKASGAHPTEANYVIRANSNPQSGGVSSFVDLIQPKEKEDGVANKITPEFVASNLQIKPHRRKETYTERYSHERSGASDRVAIRN